MKIFAGFQGAFFKKLPEWGVGQSPISNQIRYNTLQTQ